MEIADVIRTMDMSMPSYGDISNYKASVENSKSLSVEAAAEAKKGKSDQKKDFFGNTQNPQTAAGKFLPSMRKSSAEAKKAATKESSSTEYQF